MIVERSLHPAGRPILSRTILLSAAVIALALPCDAEGQTDSNRRTATAAGDVAATPEAIVRGALALHYPEVLQGIGADAPVIVVADTADRVLRVRRVVLADRTPGTRRMSIELPDGVQQGDVASVEVVNEVSGSRGPLRVVAVLVRLTPAASAYFAAERDG